MALTVGYKTLAMVRNSVAIRCNLGSQPQRVRQLLPLMDSLIQEAHKELASRCDEWLAGKRQEDIALVEAQQNYDLPDDCLPGQIQEMVAVDTNGNEYLVEWGMRPQERNSVNPDTGLGRSMPLRAEMNANGELVLWPSPEISSWPTLRLRYQATPNDLNEEDDRIVVDFDVLVKLASHKMRMAMKLPAVETPEEMESFIMGIIALQGDGEIFDFIGYRSFRNRHARKNRITASSTPISGPGWVPPGF